ncbi:type II toxin-antitoxin system HipA family toxin [Amaricoccus sp.]|uniref:type II toxin-antitoxin system HipA family toxin n=1 Tax=Amaricoccus sp. TaxID=1872485 RepID=UPI00263219DA|nr:type II toxin-antitoxin system HipA family toxin [Amaricoccus sp.]HRO10123.1 type II toxin-antitoxin system HipA family toxin [Amaricoccus sp.]
MTGEADAGRIEGVAPADGTFAARVPVYLDALHLGDVQVAEDGALSFAYTPDWLATRGAFPLSLTIPLRPGQHARDVVEPWLANLLPEEQQLVQVARSLGLDRSDALAILREIGGDTAGALSFGAPSDPAAGTYTPLTEFYGTPDEAAALERHFDDLGRRPFLAGEDGVRQSLAGGQRKSALAVLDRDGRAVLRLPGDGDMLAIPRQGAPSTVIVKPDNPSLPGIVENEVYCLRLARAAGIEAVSVTALAAGRRQAICVLRYDRRIGRTGRIIRLHQEDFAQANALPPGLKYEVGTIPGLTLEALLKTGRALPPADALALLDQVIFNILVANADAHAKNYALVLPVSGRPRLAPLYDVSSVLPWEQVNPFFAQKLAGRKRKPGDVAARHWDTISAAAGFRPADVRARVAELIDRIVANRVPVTRQVVALPGIVPGYVEQVAALVEENVLRIGGRLR